MACRVSLAKNMVNNLAALFTTGNLVKYGLHITRQILKVGEGKSKINFEG